MVRRTGIVSIVAIGVDVGQAQDPTAVVVVEYQRIELPAAALAALAPRGLFDSAPPYPEPEYDTVYGYPIALAAMVALDVALYLWFKKIRWL